MAKRRRKNRSRRRNPSIRRHRRHYSRRRRNPGMRTRTVIKYRTRRHRVARRGRRRNPGSGSIGADAGMVGGIVGGIVINNFAMGFLGSAMPTFATGVPGYIASAVIAVLQGQIVGKALRKPALGKSLTFGGLAYTTVKILNDFFPTFSTGLQGLGAIAPTGGFFNPQVNKWGSMGLFQAPNTLLNAVALAGAGKGMKGLGEPNFSARRVGRIQ